DDTGRLIKAKVLHNSWGTLATITASTAVVYFIRQELLRRYARHREHEECARGEHDNCSFHNTSVIGY
ncbi:MAG: hypothetical protein HY420_02820, partial [Candidatus Kerfeldbacteria bacterium]|nr:hypothetical protein [Candidatus Kerfeldbacteria bacterium]